MADGTKIQWTEATWPIVNGCRRVSPGCGCADGGGCYAERLIATRLKHLPKYAGLAVMTPSGPRWTGESRLWAPDLALPLKWKRPRKIFVADMGDLFYEAVSNEDIAAVFGVMAAAPKHTFQVLTKRAKRMREWFAINNIQAFVQHEKRKHSDDDETANVWTRWPLPNVWLGVSVEDQKTADERIPILLDTPAAVRWASYEPALGPVDFRQWLPNAGRCESRGGGPPPFRCGLPLGHGGSHSALIPTSAPWSRCAPFAKPALDWIVVGGESGPKARPFNVSWARETIANCRAAGVPVFVKQLGARPRVSYYDHEWRNALDARGLNWPDPLDHDIALEGQPPLEALVELRLRDAKGGDPAEWPEALRVREFPEVRA